MELLILSPGVVGVVGFVEVVGVVGAVVGTVAWVLGVAGPAGFVPQAAMPNTITTASNKAKILFINAIFLSLSFIKQFLKYLFVMIHYIKRCCKESEM